jgi:hypothetical protein
LTVFVNEKKKRLSRFLLFKWKPQQWGRKTTTHPTTVENG